MMNLTPRQWAAFPPDTNEGDLVVSASRLKKIGGEKGSPGCERRYVAEYLLGQKQSGSRATEFGSSLHLLAQVFQETGHVAIPESELGTVFRAGFHLLETCGKLLVEYEHVGCLPDGTPFVAYLDGHSAGGGATNCVVIQDLKTTSGAEWALTGTEEGEEAEPAIDPKDLRLDLQAMFYAWIMLCLPHWFCPPLLDGHYGPKHWQWWDPAERDAKCARLCWLYFLTRGKPRAWDASAFVTTADAATFMQATIMPLVERLVALHAWRKAHPESDLNTFDRNTDACKRRGSYGHFCGAGERDTCDFSEPGTPVLHLLTKGPKKMTSVNDRMAALRAKHGIGTAPASTPAPETPKAQEAAETPVATTPSSSLAPASESVAPTAQETTAVVAESPTISVTAPAALTAADPAPAAKKPRGRPAAKQVAPPPTQDPSTGINPPESAAAVAAMQQAAEAERAAGPGPLIDLSDTLTTEVVVQFLIDRGYTVTITKGAPL